MDQQTTGSIEIHTDDGIGSIEPFPHLAIPAILSAAAAGKVLDWLKTTAPWRLRIASFYEQHEFSLLSEGGAEIAEELASDRVVESMRGLIRDNFDVTGALTLVDVAAHKLTSGQTIRIHNDSIHGQETHRVLIQLNDGWSVDRGGLLMLFGSNAPEDVHSVIVPTHGSGFAFEISDKSFHAVSTIRTGERFTVVYTFRETR